AGDLIHIYLNKESGAWCDCEGEVFVDTTTVTGAGTWVINHNLGLTTAAANAITATQTTPLKSTSEFSACIPLPLPVSLLYFEATKMESYVALNWATSEEYNNREFVIQKSSDSLNFTPIGTVEGNGNKNNTSLYSFEDHTISSGTSYYRLMQVDEDGTIQYSPIRSISDISEDIILYVTEDGELFIKAFFPVSAEKINLTILNALGQLCYQQNMEAEKGRYSYQTSLNELPTGLYIIKVYTETQNVVKKIILDSEY
ncbi:MAG TPA: T9SS type A sorting domain-containing protein, partial [Verrucomicrobiae bacterium]|nr:T9SS type A sorting domain-containing protein [Verrucomicrobiae bacterium]